MTEAAGNEFSTCLAEVAAGLKALRISLGLPPLLPDHWRDETNSTALLRSAIEAYMLKQNMSAEQLAAMRGYVGKRINAPAFGGPEVGELRSVIWNVGNWAQMFDWMQRAKAVGCDPL